VCVVCVWLDDRMMFQLRISCVCEERERGCVGACLWVRVCVVFWYAISCVRKYACMVLYGCVRKCVWKYGSLLIERERERESVRV